jgi:beta-glucosidase
VNDPAASVTRPVKELKGFGKVRLEPGEERLLKFILPVELLSFFDREMTMVVEPGEFKIMVGASSEDIRLEKTIVGKGEKRTLERRTKYSTKFVKK